MISQTDFMVRIRSFSASCDFCGIAAPKPKRLSDSTLTIRPFADEFGNPSHWLNGEPYEVVEPLTRHEYLSQLMDAGWEEEAFHGKFLLACPKCAKK